MMTLKTLKSKDHMIRSAEAPLYLLSAGTPPGAYDDILEAVDEHVEHCSAISKVQILLLTCSQHSERPPRLFKCQQTLTD